jgi:RNA polymerase sigma-70 factor (ECF subfamily)
VTLSDLIDDYGVPLMRLLTHVLHDVQEAEDCWQETWFSVWCARDRLQPGRSPWAFIRTTGLRKALDRRRHQHPAAGLESEPVQRPPVIPVEVPELMELLPSERASLVLFFWEGLSVAEIAETLSVPPGTVKTWMFRGRARLRAALLAREEAP